MPIREADSAAHVDAGESCRDRELFRRWPTALGVGLATLLLITGAASRETLAIGATAAAWCYVVAAASGRRWVGWAAIPGAFVVILVSELIGLPWWTGLSATAVVSVILGLRRPTGRAALLAQGAALTGICLVAVTALAWEPRAGVVLAGLLLASHAIWDAVHYHRRLVVSRSLAEACLALDLVLGLGLITVAALAW